MEAFFEKTIRPSLLDFVIEPVEEANADAPF